MRTSLTFVAALTLLCVACDAKQFKSLTPGARSGSGADAEASPGPTANVQGDSPAPQQDVEGGTVVNSPTPSSGGDSTDSDPSTKGTPESILAVIPSPTATVVGAVVPTPSVSPTPIVCTYPTQFNALGSIGGSGAFKNVGEKVHAPLNFPNGFFSVVSEYTLKRVEIGNYEFVNAGTLELRHVGGTLAVHPIQDIGPIRNDGQSRPEFTMVVSQKPNDNAKQQYFYVWYTLEYKTNGACLP